MALRLPVKSKHRVENCSTKQVELCQDNKQETIRNLSTNNLFWLGRFCLLITFFTTRGQLSIIQKKWKTNQKATWDTYFKSEICTSKNHQKKILVFRSYVWCWLLPASKVLVVCNFNECLMVDMSEFISFHFVWDWVRGPTTKFRFEIGHLVMPPWRFSYVKLFQHFNTYVPNIIIIVSKPNYR